MRRTTRLDEALKHLQTLDLGLKNALYFIDGAIRDAEALDDKYLIRQLQNIRLLVSASHPCEYVINEILLPLMDKYSGIFEEIERVRYV